MVRVHTGVDKADCARVALIIDPVADDHLQTWEGDAWIAASYEHNVHASHAEHFALPRELISTRSIALSQARRAVLAVGKGIYLRRCRSGSGQGGAAQTQTGQPWVSAW